MSNKKALAAIVGLLALTFVVPATAQQEGDGINANLAFRDGILVDVEVVDTPPTTTTTQPPTTTTTEPPVTTTTQPPTTTTTAPPTTTTTLPPDVELGPDPAYPSNNQICAARNGIEDFCHYDVWFNAGVGDDPGQRLWMTPYSRRAADGSVLWVDGTRDRYTAQWQFAQCDNDPGFEARIAFLMGYSPQIGAVQIGDEGGFEGQLRWDGSPQVPPGRETGDKPRDIEAGPNYNGPSQPPTFRLYNVNTGEVCEVRDYKTAEETHSHGSDPFDPVPSNVTFRVDAAASTTEQFEDDRAFLSPSFTVYGEQVVKAYLDGVEAVVGYYTVLDPDYEWHVTP